MNLTKCVNFFVHSERAGALEETFCTTLCLKGDIPDNLIDTLPLPDGDIFPNIRKLILVGYTSPIGSCEAELSFSPSDVWKHTCVPPWQRRGWRASPWWQSGVIKEDSCAAPSCLTKHNCVVHLAKNQLFHSIYVNCFEIYALIIFFCKTNIVWFFRFVNSLLELILELLNFIWALFLIISLFIHFIIN